MERGEEVLSRVAIGLRHWKRREWFQILLILPKESEAIERLENDGKLTETNKKQNETTPGK